MTKLFLKCLQILRKQQSRSDVYGQDRAYTCSLFRIWCNKPRWFHRIYIIHAAPIRNDGVVLDSGGHQCSLLSVPSVQTDALSGTIKQLSSFLCICISSYSCPQARMGLLTRTLSHAGVDLFHFIVLFMLTFLGTRRPNVLDLETSCCVHRRLLLYGVSLIRSSTEGVYEFGRVNDYLLRDDCRKLWGEWVYYLGQLVFSSVWSFSPFPFSFSSLRISLLTLSTWCRSDDSWITSDHPLLPGWFSTGPISLSYSSFSSTFSSLFSWTPSPRSNQTPSLRQRCWKSSQRYASLCLLCFGKHETLWLCFPLVLLYIIYMFASCYSICSSLPL